ncbi:MAG TPA: hypothetical protein VNS09_25050 [Solirubrobacter sp.]|nr:hypothetical protein [Solirubrobacter sp.]
MVSLWALGGASTLAAFGVVLLLVAVAGAPPERGARHWRGPAAFACAVCALAAGMLVELAHPLAALSAAGATLVAGALVIVAVRARRRDDGDGGGGFGGADPPPEDPGGGGDWERFEAAFWAYVHEREPAGV